MTVRPPASPLVKAPPPRLLAGAGLPMWAAVGHFVVRAPARLARTALPAFLQRLTLQPGRTVDVARVNRLTRRWLRLPGLRARDTCYLRSLVLFRFLDPAGGDLRLHLGVDEPRSPGERLHGHAWVSLDGRPVNPPESLGQGRLREIYWFSSRFGDASGADAALAAAMIRSRGADLAPGTPGRASSASATRFEAS